MTTFARTLACSVATACLALALGASPALAAPHHDPSCRPHPHARRHRSRHHYHYHYHYHAKSNAILRIVQEHLAHLGYYAGRIDGLMGPKTRAAIKRFQREHGLKVDGIPGPKTSHALEVADVPAPVPGPLTHESVIAPDINPDAPVNPDYASSLNGGTKTLTNRFASLDVSESGMGGDRQYNVNLNGKPLLTANGQPSIIGISPTYAVGGEDAIVFTTYNAGDSVCAYGNHVLVLNATGSKMLDIENCTRNFQARVVNGSLYVGFPELDDKRDIGATWRLTGTDLERL